MDKIGHEAMLFDFYGQLLTEKQIQILDMYVNNDFSLGEIAEELSISRQGVHDTVKRSVKALEDYEERLGLVNRYMTQKTVLIEIKGKIEQMKSGSRDGTSGSELDEIVQLVEKLL